MDPGIQNSVSGKVSVDQLIKTVLVNGLWLLTSGRDCLLSVVILWFLCVGRQEFIGRGRPLGAGGSWILYSYLLTNAYWWDLCRHNKNINIKMKTLFVI